MVRRNRLNGQTVLGLGEAIQMLRLEQDLSRRDVANHLVEAELTTPQSAENYLGKIERGVKTPSQKVLTAIAQSLGVSQAQLLRRAAAITAGHEAVEKPGSVLSGPVAVAALTAAWAADGVPTLRLLADTRAAAGSRMGQVSRRRLLNRLSAQVEQLPDNELEFLVAYLDAQLKQTRVGGKVAGS